MTTPEVTVTVAVPCMERVLLTVGGVAKVLVLAPVPERVRL